MTVEAVPHKNRVLVVDDSPDDAAMLTEILSQDFTVIVASSAEEALERLREASVHVVCSNYEMPGMDGVGFLRRVLTLPEPPCFLLITSAAEMRDQKLDGLSGVIVKPFDGKALVERVHRLCQIAETRRRVASARDSIRRQTSEPREG